MNRSKKTSVPDQLKLFQSMLWYNEKYRMFLSTHHTNNPQEYYCFFQDIKSGLRKHGKYRLTTEAIVMEFFKVNYCIKYLTNMRTYDIYMIQTINIENELDYMNWLGTPIPKKKGAPYIIQPVRYESVGK